VILPGEDAERAISVARSIAHVLEQDSYSAQLPVEIKTSIGIALFPAHGDEPDMLLQHAAVAMWGARRDGSGYALYTADRDPFSPRRLGLMGELRHAIEDNRLVLHYQAKVELDTRRVTGAEALVRWQHPTLGLLAPAQFIPLAEQSGLIRPLARWVLNEVMRQHEAWHTQGVTIPIAANLSTHNLLDPQLQDHVLQLLNTWTGVPISLELEITESSIMSELPRTAEILECLRMWGIRLSVDDFGTGYSSLAYLRKLPVSELKIDKSFVIGMESSVEDGIIVRSIVDLGHNLGLKVVAEGVENPQIWNLVVPLGCDAAQGFHIGPPLPGQDLPCWLKTSDWNL
jgi:EAL domain-containing protein (putative c-di-GMP-specific phosphodiesterase class I)